MQMNAAKKRILFVDDEPAVLSGLEGLMRADRKRWEVVFAANAPAALSQLASCPVDVVVSDLRMPGMDGASLLQRVRDDYPDTVRIVLSGYNDPNADLRSLPFAHQHLAKPCAPVVLRGAIEWACNIQSMLSKASIRRAIGEVETLPSLPYLYIRLSQAIEDPSASLVDIAGIIQQDMSMSAKILQIVNSSFFGLGHKVSSIENAVSYLGTNMIRNLLLSIEVFGAFLKSPLPCGLSQELLQRHSLFSAQLVKKLMKGEDVFTAAILHEIGILLLATRFPEAFEQIVAFMKKNSCSLTFAEQELLGVTHAEVGAYLLGLWGLPYSIVEAVANHHSADSESNPLVSALSIAERFADYYVPLFPSTKTPSAISSLAKFIQDNDLLEFASFAASEARNLNPTEE
jgi:HD-like signal output (HDOD) protein/ActR/RegA family two-component response regulator